MLSLVSAQRFVGLVSCFSLMLIQPTMAQEQVLRTLTVTGEGIQRIPATVAQVELGVEVNGTEATTVQQEVAKRTNAVVDFLKSRNVQRLQTTGVRLQPNYDYSNNQRRLLGYIGVNTVSFRYPVEQVGVLLDEAVKTGATRIDNVSLTATDEAISQAQKQALQAATQDAQDQGNSVLQYLNLSPKEIISIQVNGANVPVPQMVQSQQFSVKADAASTPIIGGEQTVRASVTLQIKY